MRVKASLTEVAELWPLETQAPLRLSFVLTLGRRSHKMLLYSTDCTEEWSEFDSRQNNKCCLLHIVQSGSAALRDNFIFNPT
jgi:hypothetical protein